MMTCVAIHGYHHLFTNSWLKDGDVFPGQESPIVIAGVGNYQCLVTFNSHVLGSKFTVSGKLCEH